MQLFHHRFLPERLELLQTYMNNQKPSRKRDMFRDRRNANEHVISMLDAPSESYVHL